MHDVAVHEACWNRDGAPVQGSIVTERWRTRSAHACRSVRQYRPSFGPLQSRAGGGGWPLRAEAAEPHSCRNTPARRLPAQDRKSTRLNSSHANISYAVFCLKKKNTLQRVE